MPLCRRNSTGNLVHLNLMPNSRTPAVDCRNLGRRRRIHRLSAFAPPRGRLSASPFSRRSLSHLVPSLAAVFLSSCATTRGWWPIVYPRRGGVVWAV
ncbi:hypothetical protein HanPSC8_Chr07g0300971 [Helianthus annuus]|nr:hypothetical protein HanPSC8_Chr07g0300971 [Helianthus annuus]